MWLHFTLIFQRIVLLLLVDWSKNFIEPIFLENLIIEESFL